MPMAEPNLTQGEAPPVTPAVGRPSLVDQQGRPTRERLLAAATAACVEHGFEGATLGDIAQRAGVSTPAIYNHFLSRSQLLVEACRTELRKLSTSTDNQAQVADESPQDMAVRVIDAYLSPEFAATRALQLEIHGAARKHPEVFELLREWHAEIAVGQSSYGTPAQVKAWYMLLLGLAQLDALEDMAVETTEVRRHVLAMAATLFSSAD